MRDGKVAAARAKLIGLLLVACVVASASGVELRGFGELEKSTSAESGELNVRRFVCESPEKARLLLHKLGRDLSQSVTEEAFWRTVKIGRHPANVLVRPRQASYLPVARGNVLTVYAAPEGSDPGTVFAGIADELEEARFFDPDFTYPRYLDKFSHYGIGAWYPNYWRSSFAEGKPDDVDDHFAFAQDLDLVLQPNSSGHLLREILPKLHEYNRPWHFAQWQEWSAELAIMAPEELVVPGPDFSTSPPYYGGFSDGADKLIGWQNWRFQQLMRQFKDDPLLVDWLDPNGEVGPKAQDYFWDFSENNRRRLVRFLREDRGYTLESLGEAWHGDPGRFKSWDAVPIPMGYEYYGWTADSIRADREWRLHPVGVKGAETRGLEQGYHRPDFDDSNWVELSMPGGELAMLFGHARERVWHRGTIDVPADWLEAKRKAGPVYLNAVTFAITSAPYRADRVWFNGQELSALSRPGGQPLHGQLDVTHLIRSGRNTIAYLPIYKNKSRGRGMLRGTFFLCDQRKEEYPFADPHLNARYADWHEYVSWSNARMLEETFRAIRAIDPDRPIKMHAFKPKNLGVPLAAKYGVFGHNTGDEAFFRPWDRRFGYVRGIPASCEPSGSVNDPAHFKRWLGWHCFTGGPNGLDYFHNIQSMMYSPCADLWREYMPYWKLGPRRVIKKPDIALFWSSRNNGLLPTGIPYCFDLGRGDLQPLGYSYVYVDESTLRDGLVDDYPVLWDSGTWVMDPDTIAGLRQYVEAGGTYVLLHETGRHTTTDRDAWSVTDLTGFRPSAERPMTGTLSILYEQPLFEKLAGRIFYNRGKSIDYSGYNFADKCFALEPVAEGAQAIARYEDGNIAIGMRRLGKGRVIVLGSPFWRDSYDKGGMWWPGETQNAFLEDLLAGLGLQPLATADSHKVWREHYLATNGAEEFLFLHNPYDEPVTFSTTWVTVHPAARLFDPKNGKEITGAVEGRSVNLEDLTLTARETLIVATQPRKAPATVVDDWYGELAKLWRKSAAGEVLERPDLPVYHLRLEAELYGKVVTPAEAAALPQLPADAELGACQSPEAFEDHPDPDRQCAFYARFATPPSWREKDHVTLYIQALSRFGDVVGPVDAWFNGQQVLEQADAGADGRDPLSGGASIDIGPLLRRDGENVLVFKTGPNGFIGEVDIDRRPAPAEEFRVDGMWQMQADADSGLSSVELPGEMRGLFAYTDVTVPAEWQGDRVFVELDVEGHYTAFAINDKVVFHPLGRRYQVTYMDVTPWVQLGEANRLTLISVAKSWKPGRMKVNAVTVQRVEHR